MSSIIEVSGLTKRYRDHTAVEDLSFKVEPGEKLGRDLRNARTGLTKDEAPQVLG